MDLCNILSGQSDMKVVFHHKKGREEGKQHSVSRTMELCVVYVFRSYSLLCRTASLQLPFNLFNSAFCVLSDLVLTGRVPTVPGEVPTKQTCVPEELQLEPDATHRETWRHEEEFTATITVLQLTHCCFLRHWSDQCNNSTVCLFFQRNDLLLLMVVNSMYLNSVNNS